MARAGDPGERTWFSTAEVAGLLTVSPATVKRWAEAGVLASERTQGGHRRFRREHVEQLRRAGATVGLPGVGVADSWIELLLSPAPDLAVCAALLEVRSRLGSWPAVGESFAPVLDELGARWARGQLSVIEEHIASARLSRALGWAAENLVVAGSAPRALLATPAAEEHTLGLSLVEVCLREDGWRTVWAGRNVPLGDLESFVRGGAVSAILLSASVCSEASALATAATVLGRAAHETGVALVLGGGGAWPEPGPGVRLRTLTALRAWTTEAASTRR